ncbi:MAG TPA: exosortase A [Geminicoccaceae bacterium]
MSTTAAEPVAGASKPGVAAWPAAWASAALGLLAVSATAAFLHWDAIVAAAATWRGSPTYGYGMLVPPVAVWLVCRRRDVLRQTAPRPWPIGLVLVGGAALAATAGQVVSALVVEQLALVAMLQAAALAIVGPTAFRLLAFPLFYLYLAVPVGDSLIAPLQEVTARFAVAALELVGVPVRLDGLLIQIPSATFHVAEACAGLRFLLASLAVGLLLAHLFFRSWWARLAFTALSIGLPILGNALRAAGVVLIAHLGDTRLALGFDHLTYGYLFTAVLLGCMVGLAAVLGSPRRVAGPLRSPVPRTASPGWTLTIAGGAVLATALPALAARPGAEPCPTAPVLEPPRIAAPWTPVSAAGDWRPDVANPDAELWQGYRRGEGRVDLYVGYYCAQRQGAEVVSQAHRLTGGAHWLVQAQGRDRLNLAGSRQPVQVADVRFAGQNRLVLVWYWVDGRFTADPLVAKLLQAKEALLGGPAAAAVIVASTSYRSDAPAARTIIGEALAALEPLQDILKRAADSAATATD